jgi:RimJ/RimL family protein N-acetyltransferase
MSTADPEVRLRTVTASDVDVFFAQEQEPAAQRRANFPARTYDAFVQHWTARVLGDPSVRALTVTAGDAVAGNIVSWWKDGQRQVGYWLGESFWGRGIGTTALTQFLAIETTRPLHADADAGNTASIRLLKRCGFAEIGVVREETVSYVLLRLR